MAGPNHSYTYQTETEPNRFHFTPEQVVFCCLDHGRAKKAPFDAVPTDDGVAVTLMLSNALIEKSCRTDVRFHGGCRELSVETYKHGDDGSFTIEIQEPRLPELITHKNHALQNAQQEEDAGNFEQAAILYEEACRHEGVIAFELKHQGSNEYHIHEESQTVCRQKANEMRAK